MVKKLTHEDLMRETSEQESIRMKAAEEYVEAHGWYESCIAFFHHKQSSYWMDMNTGVICIYHNDHKHTGEVDDYSEGFAYTGEDALEWIMEHDPSYMYFAERQKK